MTPTSGKKGCDSNCTGENLSNGDEEETDHPAGWFRWFQSADTRHAAAIRECRKANPEEATPEEGREEATDAPEEDRDAEEADDAEEETGPHGEGFRSS